MIDYYNKYKKYKSKSKSITKSKISPKSNSEFDKVSKKLKSENI